MHEPLALSLHNKSGSTRELHAPNARLQNREQEVREESTRRYFSRTRTKKTDKRSNEERSSKLSQGVPPPRNPRSFPFDSPPTLPRVIANSKGSRGSPSSLTPFRSSRAVSTRVAMGDRPRFFHEWNRRFPFFPKPPPTPPSTGPRRRGMELGAANLPKLFSASRRRCNTELFNTNKA